jgi:hypothetical protein
MASTAGAHLVASAGSNELLTQHTLQISWRFLSMRSLSDSADSGFSVGESADLGLIDRFGVQQS